MANERVTMKAFKQTVVVCSKQKFEIGDYIVSCRFGKISIGMIHEVIKPSLKKNNERTTNGTFRKTN